MSESAFPWPEPGDPLYPKFENDVGSGDSPIQVVQMEEDYAAQVFLVLADDGRVYLVEWSEKLSAWVVE